jgi:ArsR family transcriptional regulator
MGGVPQGSETLRSLQRISDPTRARILSLILDSTDGRAPVTRLAETLGTPTTTL